MDLIMFLFDLENKIKLCLCDVGLYFMFDNQVQFVIFNKKRVKLIVEYRRGEIFLIEVFGKRNKKIYFFQYFKFIRVLKLESFIEG